MLFLYKINYDKNTLIHRTLIHFSFWNNFKFIKMIAFWLVAPCSLAEANRRFRGSCWLHHQGDESYRLPVRKIPLVADSKKLSRLFNSKRLHKHVTLTMQLRLHRQSFLLWTETNSSFTSAVQWFRSELWFIACSFPRSWAFRRLLQPTFDIVQLPVQNYFISDLLRSVGCRRFNVVPDNLNRIS
jgi:hypothetical protein